METDRELLKKGLMEMGLIPAEDLVAGFLSYTSELKKWNRAYNLTALKNDRDIITKHFLDSLLFLKAFPESLQTVCDAGSGAGFPGVPIAMIKSELSIFLVEPSRKKCAFLRNLKKNLALNNITVLESRVEDLIDINFDVIVTRALFSIDEFIKKTKSIVKQDGCLIMSKGPKFQDELKEIPPSVHFEHITAILPLISLKRNLIRITR